MDWMSTGRSISTLLTGLELRARSYAGDRAMYHHTPGDTDYGMHTHGLEVRYATLLKKRTDDRAC